MSDTTTPDKVLGFARAAVGKATPDWRNLCLMFVRMAYGTEAKYPTADEARRHADNVRTSGEPPAGAVMFWTGGPVAKSTGRPAGHVAISAGNWNLYGTDTKREGRVDLMSLAYLSAKWPSLKYVGWTDNVNGARCELADARAQLVQLDNLRAFLRNEDVRTFQNALRRAGHSRLNPSGATGFYGDETRAMCRAFQESQGWSGADADGFPGPETLARLGLVS